MQILFLDKNDTEGFRYGIVRWKTHSDMGRIQKKRQNTFDTMLIVIKSLQWWSERVHYTFHVFKIVCKKQGKATEFSVFSAHFAIVKVSPNNMGLVTVAKILTLHSLSSFLTIRIAWIQTCMVELNILLGSQYIISSLHKSPQVLYLCLYFLQCLSSTYTWTLLIWLSIRFLHVFLKTQFLWRDIS